MLNLLCTRQDYLHTDVHHSLQPGSLLYTLGFTLLNTPKYPRIITWMRCYIIIILSLVGSDHDLLGILVVADTRHVRNVGGHRLHLVHEGISHSRIVLEEDVENKQTLYSFTMIFVYNVLVVKMFTISKCVTQIDC